MPYPPNASNEILAILSAGNIYSELPPDGFVWPSDLPAVTATRVGDGFLCNIGPQDLIDTTEITKVYRVDLENGDDANSGSNWTTTPLKSIWRALELAMAPMAGLDCKIFVKGGQDYPLGNGFLENDVSVDLKNRTIVIEGVYGRPTIGAFSLNTWALEGGQSNTYSCTRSDAVIAVNPSMTINDTPDRKGGYIQYKNVNSIGEVEAEEGTFYVNGTTCYAHPHGSVVATDRNVRIFENKNQLRATNVGNSLLRNIDPEGGRLGAVYSGSVNVRSGRLVTDGTTHRYCIGGTFAAPVVWNAFSISDLEIEAFFNTDASYNSSDGFSTAGGGSNQNQSMLIVNSTSSYNGLLTQEAPSGSKPTSVNGVTGHDGTSTISIGGQYLGSTGTSIAFVHEDTKAWIIGAEAGDSEGDSVNGKAIVCGGASVDGVNAQLWMDSCNVAGCDRELQATGSGEILLRRHTGSGNRQATTGTITDY